MILLASLLFSTLSAAETARPTGLRIEGTFIQYQEWMTRMSREEWKRELDAARDAGMRTLIVQWLRHGDRKYLGGSLDLTSVLMEYADLNGMRVFVGLAADEGWWRGWNDPDYLRRAGDTCVQTAAEAWKRYGKHRSFAGWYLPHELWDIPFTPEQIARLRGFYRRMSDECKRLSDGKPVAIAPFFTGLMQPKRVAEHYGRLLEGAGVDIVMLQDGVGARGWDAQVEEKLPPYFAAFREACLAAGVELWSDLECFQKAPEGGMTLFEPARIERVLEQLAVAGPYVRRVVTFDWFHYMSPSRGEPARRLWEGYRRYCLDRPYMPWLGRSLQVDPTFAYYRGRSPESIADEVRANGYPLVHYVIDAAKTLDERLLQAFVQKGIGVWYLTLGNGTYRPWDLPAGWEAWKMVTRSDLAGNPLQDGYTRLCLNNPDYRAWKKESMAGVLRGRKFVGVEIAEPHWPEYPGISSPAYACFCDHCRRAFRQAFPDEADLPDVLDAGSARHPNNNPRLWEKWLRFRRETLNGFLDDLVNGPGGLRQTSPGVKVCTWTLALMGEQGMRHVLEDHGEHAGDVVRRVRPDAHCLQTHWPDWMKADLPGDYVQQYRPYMEQITAAAPGTPVVFQADTGSLKPNRRSWEWIWEFERACRRMGAQGSMLYEYFIGGYMYEEPPRVVEALRTGDAIHLLFTKRLDPKTAGEASRYTLSQGTVTGVEVDGSVVTLRAAGLPKGGRVALSLRGIADAADRRLFDDSPACVLPEQRLIVAP